MGFFSYHLKKDDYAIPWQFVSLATVSAATFFSVFALGIAFCCRALNPIFSMVVDVLLWLLWGVAGGALGRGLAPNLMKQCNLSQWGNKQGVTVCHMYKNVFAFVVVGWVTLLCSFILGAYARSRSGPKYVPANPKSLQQTTAYTPSTQVGQTAGKDAPYGAGGTYKPQDHGNPSYYT